MTVSVTREMRSAGATEMTRFGYPLPPLKALEATYLAMRALDPQVASLEGRLAETQMLAFKWMEAHDKLHAGKPYHFPKPADLPDRIASLEAALEKILAASDVGRSTLDVLVEVKGIARAALATTQKG